LIFIRTPADPMRLIPVYLGLPNPVIGKANRGDTLKFSPPPSSVTLSESGGVADASADRDRLDVGDLTDDLKVHRGAARSLRIGYRSWMISSPL